jgi:hypothetical protein
LNSNYGPQVSVLRLQVGVPASSAPQSASVRHCTQVAVARLQTGAAALPLQSAVWVH